MSNDINLLSTAKIKSEEKEKLVNVLKIVSLTSLVGVLLVSFILFILAKQFSVDSIREKQSAVIKNINFLKEKHAKLILTEKKIEEISKIIKKRSKFDNSLRIIDNKIPSGVSSQAILLNRQKVNLYVTSNSLRDIDKFINNFTEMARSKNLIQDFSIESVILDSQRGNYSVNVSAQML